MNHNERALLANAADILGVDLECSESKSAKIIRGKGQRGVELFDGFFLNVVPKVMDGVLAGNRGNPVVNLMLQLSGALDAMLILEEDQKHPAEFRASLILLEHSKIEFKFKGNKLFSYSSWSRSSVFRRVESAVVAAFTLGTYESDGWQQLPDNPVAEYNKHRNNGHESHEALEMVGMA